MGSMQLLPPELLCKVFSHLPLPSKLACRAVSRVWNGVASQSSQLWTGQQFNPSFYHKAKFFPHKGLKLCVRSNHGEVAGMLRKPCGGLFSNVEQITLFRSLCDGNLMVTRLMTVVTQMLDAGKFKMIKDTGRKLK